MSNVSRVKQHRILRADTLRHGVNRGKEAKLRAFVADYRRLAVVLGREQWRLFFEAGRFNRQHASTTLNHICGAAPVQMARYQVVEQFKGWLGNLANEFRTIVQRSSLPPETRHMLHTINRTGAWFQRDDVVMKNTGEIVPPEVRRLARSIMRRVMNRHRKPNLSRISPRLDARVATVAPSRWARHDGLWATFRLPYRGIVAVPLHAHRHFRERDGELCPVVQIVTGGDGLGFQLVTDITTAAEASRAAYVPRTERVAIDFGLATLMATDRGDLFGRGWLNDLLRIDKQITSIARHRMRSGERPRDSARYRRLVSRLRGMIRTRINATLNRIVAVHAPAELVVERLDFRMSCLSRRLNRILANCGRSAFKAKLADLEERFGVVAAEVNPAYTSQECSGCGYVDARNRRSQSEFSCRWCGRERHADVNGACVIGSRRSRPLGATSLHRGEILGVLVRAHAERWPDVRLNGRQGTADDPRLSNRYFAGWVAAARKLPTSHGVASCE